jgi:hypothetical protein
MYDFNCASTSICRISLDTWELTPSGKRQSSNLHGSDSILIRRGTVIVDRTEANVKVLLEKDAVSPTNPWFMRVGDSDVEIPKQLQKIRVSQGDVRFPRIPTVNKTKRDSSRSKACLPQI